MPPPIMPPAAVTAPPTAPPAEALARAYLDAFNSGDRATLKAFFEKNRPSKVEHVDDELRFRSMTGGFDLKQVQTSTATDCTGLVKERDSDQFALFEVEVAPDAAHLITKLSVRAIPTPHEFAVPRLTDTEAVAALGAELEKAAAADGFSGVALVVKQGKVLFAHAYGLANRETRTANQVETQFRLGSMNKMFTAVAVLQLVQAGKIQLNASLSTYLPDYPNKDLAEKVTIHHLLTHTGGTGDIFGPDFEAHRLELKTLGDYIKLYGARALEFEPGAQWRYSNYGYLLLGAVIEKVSRRSYYDYVREHIFAPAGMVSTDSEPEEASVPGRAVGYMKDAPGADWRPSTETLPYRGTSAGGGYSTVEDLNRFATALQANLLLDAKHTELLDHAQALSGLQATVWIRLQHRRRGGVSVLRPQRRRTGNER